ncbi:thymidylate synthase [Blastococcus sp. TF02-8]|uniref:thymidylate synthase n=1 Tax=Blastococcus sp. TF02-8 TaxID=2250574 RepID=UPI000DEB652D|nr:thymidylate synthase [Blastococcus sp. TF02-8]RBY97110.1 thymidylate synthase [Blastococcus sp. TF02-8]
MPHYEAPTLDDLMRRVMTDVFESGERLNPSKGETLDLHACSLELTNPLARLSRSATRGHVFSPLGELCWYLSGSDDLGFIQHYLPHYGDYAEDDGSVMGAYGPRLVNFDGVNQIDYVIAQLSRKPASRRAVIQLFDHSDVQGEYRDVPCTCTMQFLVRHGRLQMVVNMRSNDIYKGLPHDVFSFTMLQELVARSLGLELGSYVHFVGSLHLYTSDEANVTRFLDEGWLSSEAIMPPMPPGDPWADVRALLRAEYQIRTAAEEVTYPGSPYWDDLARLLEAFEKRHQSDALQGLRSKFAYDSFWIYLRNRLDRLEVQQQPDDLSES